MIKDPFKFRDRLLHCYGECLNSQSLKHRVKTSWAAFADHKDFQTVVGHLNMNTLHWYAFHSSIDEPWMVNMQSKAAVHFVPHYTVEIRTDTDIHPRQKLSQLARSFLPKWRPWKFKRTSLETNWDLEPLVNVQPSVEHRDLMKESKRRDKREYGLPNVRLDNRKLRWYYADKAGYGDVQQREEAIRGEDQGLLMYDTTTKKHFNVEGRVLKPLPPVELSPTQLGQHGVIRVKHLFPHHTRLRHK